MVLVQINKEKEGREIYSNDESVDCGYALAPLLYTFVHVRPVDLIRIGTSMSMQCNTLCYLYG